MALFASIDVGSNTIRLLIGRVDSSHITDVYSDRRITRLGNRVGQTGVLQEENMHASMSVLSEFASVISGHGVASVRAVATSALREASNAVDFIQNVSKTTGISIEVITGEKEAELTLKGMLASVSDSGPGPSAAWLIFDIGGGSSEWIFHSDRIRTAMGSIPVGVIKLTQQFVTTDPVSQRDLDVLHREISSVVNPIQSRLAPWIDASVRLIGTAGTFTTIASIDLGLDTYSRQRIHLHSISLERLKDMLNMLVALPIQERKKVRGLEPERADLIIPGLLFTINVMESFRFRTLTISDHGLLEGLLIETKEAYEKDISEAGKP